MKLFSFSQREPVAFNGDGILLRENQIRFSLTPIEKQINKQQWVDIIPTDLSIRSLVLSDFLFFYKQIRRCEKYVVLEKVLPFNRSCKVIYDQNGLFLCALIKLRVPKYLSDFDIGYQDKMSWISYRWTLDNLGNHLLQVDYLTRNKKTYGQSLALREYVSIRGQSIVRRKVSYADSSVQKIETHLYNNDGQWIPVSGQYFPAEHWKQVDKIYSKFPSN